MTPSPVDRLPKAGEVWRLPETVKHGPVEANIVEVTRGVSVTYYCDGYTGGMSWPVFRASARFLREKARD